MGKEKINSDGNGDEQGLVGMVSLGKEGMEPMKWA